ncbi:MAG: phosphotransferase [Thermoflavifilum sp.]|nr:phosphotransferase [Thermoflavifilum sp.]MCL6513732.1 phosphotransferase [Alicyclobacillus sp.]
MARQLDGGVALPEWPSGTMLKGKWSGTVLMIERRLGTGANGAVYLARTVSGPVALKVCRTAGEAAMEWGLLDRLRSAGAPLPRPIVIDDDMESGAFFYVMEWVQGEPLHHALTRLNRVGVRTVLTQVASALAALHRTGHVFGDIKPQNILVHTRVLQTRLIDVGGITPMGRSVRQFTPYFDRAFWDLGSRRAEAHYDVCGLALAVVQSYAGSPPAQLTHQDPAARRRWLQRAIPRLPWSDLATVMEWALTDSGVGADDLARALSALPDAPPREAGVRAGKRRAAHTVGSGNPVPPPARSTAVAGRTHTAAMGTGVAGAVAGLTPSTTGRRARQAAVVPVTARRRMDWTERVMWVSLGLAAASTTLAWLAVTGWF